MDRFGALAGSEAKEWALAEGDRSRRAYYEGRLQSFTPDAGIVLCQNRGAGELLGARRPS